MKLIENKNIFKNSTFFALLPKEQKIVPVKFNSGVKYEELMNLEEQSGHHAKITIEGTQVTVEVWTHDLKDITGMDKEYARTVNEIYKDSNADIDE